MIQSPFISKQQATLQLMGSGPGNWLSPGTEQEIKVFHWLVSHLELPSSSIFTLSFLVVGKKQHSFWPPLYFISKNVESINHLHNTLQMKHRGLPPQSCRSL